MVLIDTSVWLFALKRDFHPLIKKKVETLLLTEKVAISGILQLELLGGAKSEKEYDRLSNRLDSLHHIEADRSLWDNASKLAFELKQKGVTVPYADILIAASSLKEDALLVHADSHFDLIADQSDLKVESLVSLVDTRNLG
jgi:predicted nucleic acid-binding protein